MTDCEGGCERHEGVVHDVLVSKGAWRVRFRYCHVAREHDRRIGYTVEAIDPDPDTAPSVSTPLEDWEKHPSRYCPHYPTLLLRRCCLDCNRGASNEPRSEAPGHTCEVPTEGPEGFERDEYDLRCSGCVALRISLDGPMLPIAPRPETPKAEADIRRDERRKCQEFLHGRANEIREGLDDFGVSHETQLHIISRNNAFWDAGDELINRMPSPTPTGSTDK